MLFDPTNALLSHDGVDMRQTYPPFLPEEAEAKIPISSGR